MSAANNITSPSLNDPISQDQLRVALRFSALVVVVLATASCVVYLAGALNWRAATFPGFTTAYTLVVDGNETYGSSVWAGHAAGIERLDRITRVGETSVNSGTYAQRRGDLREAFNDLNYGDTVEIGFVRPEGRVTDASDICQLDEAEGGYVPCTVSYTLAPMSQSDFLTYFVFPFVTALIALAMGITLLVLRHNSAVGLLIAMFCAALAVFSAGPFDNGTTQLLLPVWLTFTGLGAGLTVVIALVFPTRLTLTYRQPILLAVPVVVATVITIMALYLYANVPTPYAFTTVWQLPVLTAMLGFLGLFTSLVVRRRYVTSSIHRDQINTSMIGFGLAAIPVIVWLLSNIALVLDASLALPFNSATTLPFFISIPIGMAYAVLHYRPFNTDQVLSQGVTYGILLGALVIGYFFVVLGVKMLTQDLVQSDNPFVIAATIFLIAVAFLPVRTTLQQRIDEIYFRERRDYQNRVETFGREISTTGDFSEILKRYVELVQDNLNTRGIFIFLLDEESAAYVANAASQPQTDVAFDSKGDFVALLNTTVEPIRVESNERWHPALVSERSRLRLLKANLIIPLRSGREAISGFVIVGLPAANRGRYTYEDVRFLDNVSSQMGVTVERAQVIDSLERRVRELGVLSQVSQAVNFAVEFDDLLELVSAQTQKVLEAPNFYIALRDASAQQMYYAFFMEFNERIRDEENRRWQFGGDIFARIVNDAQAERLENYSQAIANRHLNPRGIDDNMKAWMGMPLIAGQNNLGVIAVGTSRAGYAYSDEQLRIFNDLAALAATSLDKARLFEETNQRARQLRALSDIARRLQYERKVERLIPLITQSAVNILEAEAGSLLLKAEDNSGDMEFRIVVGGSGQELVGTRVKAGHGIVGEVAASGESVIVNDTREDARWGGEAGEDTSFQTNSVLAVPLMANNEVIGVLEVLNKKDGSAYREEDADVLETFAGQAAIAIDNAQLFEKTDEQLSMRVQELETLEKIDAELNRALDLERVAAVTVKWTIANTGASAGMLGLIAEDTENPAMRVLNTYGYREEDLAGVVVDGSVPLNRGIVSRVMRTKQPDYQPDLDLDNEYIPSLRGANSQITVPIMAGEVIIALLILEKNVMPKLNLLDLSFVQRVTEHAAIAIENARLYGELEMVAKVQSRYMGVGAHELKNVLAPIKGWTDFLMSGMLGTVTEQQEKSLSVIKNNVGRAELIIQDLRDFAKMRAQELKISPEPTSIRNVVVETLRPFAQQFEEKNQTFVNRVLDKDLPDIMGDAQRLIQVMTNFVSNAHKYSPEDATITLDAQERTTRNGDVLVISIADTGMGISPEDQKQMFTPYFRTQAAKESEIPGTGLGMSLTKEIIMQHGGDVWLESEVDVGSTFFFSVPLAPKEEAPDNTTTVSEPASD